MILIIIVYCRCLDRDCKIALPPSIIRTVLGQEAFHRWERLLLQVCSGFLEKICMPQVPIVWLRLYSTLSTELLNECLCDSMKVNECIKFLRIEEVT